eukprot:EC720331.1.p1 GENE.EC720331.1~~EC720331.1.p1  ORF type:complete len:143 (+),score=13.95 EC720331.1:62-490(+)
MFRSLIISFRTVAQISQPSSRAFHSRISRRRAGGARDVLPLQSVVKVFTESTSPNYFLPWQNKSQVEKTGRGFAIGGKRLLTNAHVVADSSYVMVRRHGSPAKYTAKVEVVGHECDIAMLSVEDDAFWSGVAPLSTGEIPHL